MMATNKKMKKRKGEKEKRRKGAKRDNPRWETGGSCEDTGSVPFSFAGFDVLGVNGSLAFIGNAF
jgi:hypothetical protein